MDLAIDFAACISDSMLIYFATAYPSRWSYLGRFRQLAAADRFGLHQVTNDATTADLILFVDARQEHGDWRFRALRRHPLVRAHREKCLVYNETDQPWCCLPGLYVSMPARWFDRRRMAAWSYVDLINPHLAGDDGVGDAEVTLLFSFAGRRCAAVREAVLALRHPAAEIEDTTDYNFFGSSGRDEAEMDARRRDYAAQLRRSRFVLCPRGSGPASFRLFETLAAGRVPVILSDAWVPPEGPDWSACTLRVREADAARVPELLEAADPRWADMAAAARQTWREWFADDAQFHRIAEAGGRLLRNPSARRPGVRATGRRLWLEARGLKGRARATLRPARAGGPIAAGAA